MKIRIISALVLLLIFVPLLLTGGIPFAVLVLLISLIGLHELYKVKRKQKDIPILIEMFGYVLGGFLTLNNCTSNYLTLDIDYRIFAFMIFIFILPIIFINDNKKYSVDDALFMIGATLFIGLSMNLLVLIRNENLFYIIYIFLITIMTDTFALITGKFIGKNKFAPKISPKKTWEGFFGGSLCGTVVGTVFFNTIINPSLSLFAVILMTLCLSVVGQLGDLVFSSIKRHYGQKDFSNLIPGHGGILDRLDSTIFVVLGFLLFMVIL
jgi:phosphatidate cytidylyltransferase